MLGLYLYFLIFVFCTGGAPELVLHKRCPMNSLSGGGPSRCDNEHAGSNAICPDRAHDLVRSPRSGPQTLTTGSAFHFSFNSISFIFKSDLGPDL